MMIRPFVYALAVLTASRSPQYVSAAPTFEPLNPPSYPLAVRNPYLSAWLPGLEAANLPSAQVEFWDGTPLTWGIMARVDNLAYALLNVPTLPTGAENAIVNAAQYTATHTYFNLTAGSASIRLDFFSPVSPNNYNRQSLPFSYLTISAASSNGSSIQVYSDIDHSWTGQNTSTTSNFTTSGSDSIFTLSVEGAILYTQNVEQALWGQTVFASRPSASSKLSSHSGPAADIRGMFAANGSLTSADYPEYADGDVVAIVHDLGTEGGSVTYAIGYVREQAVNYLGAAMTGYYRALYPDIPAAVGHFLDDYGDANTESLTFDSGIAQKAAAVDHAGQNYSDILTLSVRQFFGGQDLVIPDDSKDTNSTMVFVKEISSDGNVNTVDVIFPMFPGWYVLDPEYIRLALEPVLSYLALGRYPRPFVIHDLGAAYPNATGHDNGDAEEQPVEETGNLLILMYAYQKASGNTAFQEKYKDLLQGYADWLIDNSINITEQLSTDDGAGPLANQTNLAIKAAIGLVAYGNLTDQNNYTQIGLSNANLLYNQKLGTDVNQTHFTLQYGNDTTYTTAFNLYPDVLLNLGVFPSGAFEMQDNYYPTVRAERGIPLDNRVDWAKTDWQLWVTATSRNVDTRQLFVNDIHDFIAEARDDNQVPLSDRFFVASGGDGKAGAFDTYMARPVVGGHFAVLALTGSNQLSIANYGPGPLLSNPPP